MIRQSNLKVAGAVLRTLTVQRMIAATAGVGIVVLVSLIGVNSSFFKSNDESLPTIGVMKILAAFNSSGGVSIETYYGFENWPSVKERELNNITVPLIKEYTDKAGAIHKLNVTNLTAALIDPGQDNWTSWGDREPKELPELPLFTEVLTKKDNPYVKAISLGGPFSEGPKLIRVNYSFNIKELTDGYGKFQLRLTDIKVLEPKILGIRVILPPQVKPRKPAEMLSDSYKITILNPEGQRVGSEHDSIGVFRHALDDKLERDIFFGRYEIYATLNNTNKEIAEVNLDIPLTANLLPGQWSDAEFQ